MTMHHESGFTLLEVLTALFLLGICVLATAPMFMHASRTNGVSADLLLTNSLAVARMELLRTQGFSTLVTGGGLTTDVTGYFDTSYPGTTVRWEVAAGANPPGSLEITVRAMVTAAAGGPQRSSTMKLLRTP